MIDALANRFKPRSKAPKQTYLYVSNEGYQVKFLELSGGLLASYRIGNNDRRGI
jgi:hypothetical protein